MSIQRVGVTGYYVMLLLYRFGELDFSTIHTLLKKRTTRKAIQLFLQRHGDLIKKRKIGFYNRYSLSDQGKQLFETEFLKDEATRMHLRMLEEEGWSRWSQSL
ncbi:MAG: hypothetical protein ACPL07_04310 [Candidatus Bathyarchaeia archaeon]